MQGDRVPRKTILPFVEQQRHILMQRPLISAKYIVRVLVDDLRRDGTLAAHRVDGHHRAVQLQLQQLRDRRDLATCSPPCIAPAPAAAVNSTPRSYGSCLAARSNERRSCHYRHHPAHWTVNRSTQAMKQLWLRVQPRKHVPQLVVRPPHGDGNKRNPSLRCRAQPRPSYRHRQALRTDTATGFLVTDTAPSPAGACRRAPRNCLRIQYGHCHHRSSDCPSQSYLLAPSVHTDYLLPVTLPEIFSRLPWPWLPCPWSWRLPRCYSTK